MKTSMKSFIFASLLMILLIINSQSFSQIPVGTVAPDFTVTDAHGITHNLNTYLNEGKYVLLKFGYVGCSGCDESRPSFTNAYYNFGCNNKDVVFIEISAQDYDADISTYSAFVNLAASMGNPLDQASPGTDPLYIYPKAPFVTVDGGGSAVTALYQISFVPVDILIEPVTKKIIQSSEEGIVEISPGYFMPGPGWSRDFLDMQLEGNGNGMAPGHSITKAFERDYPHVFHYVTSPFMDLYLYDNPGMNVPLSLVPFEPFCTVGVQACDTLIPEIINVDIQPQDDTSRTVTITWNSPDLLCDQFEIMYNIDQTLPGINNTNLTTSQNSHTLNNLIPGVYNFYVRCSCNSVYSSAYVTFEVESDTTFFDNTCSQVCDYQLLVYENPGDTSSILGSWSSLFIDAKLEIIAGNGTNMVDYFLLGNDAQTTYLNTNLINGKVYNLQFCSGDLIKLTYFEPETSFWPWGTRGGFKLYKDNNVVMEYYSDENLTSSPTFPGYSVFSLTASCEPTSISENANNLNVNIFPNPNNGDFEIRIDDNLNSKLEKLEIVDIYGHVVANESLESLNKIQGTYKFANQPAGMYILRLVNLDGKIQTHKIIIK